MGMRHLILVLCTSRIILDRILSRGYGGCLLESGAGNGSLGAEIGVRCCIESIDVFSTSFAPTLLASSYLVKRVARRAQERGIHDVCDYRRFVRGIDPTATRGVHCP